MLFVKENPALPRPYYNRSAVSKRFSLAVMVTRTPKVDWLRANKLFAVWNILEQLKIPYIAGNGFTISGSDYQLKLLLQKN